MRNRYGRAYTNPVGDWPGIEAPDESWEVNSPIDEPDLLPPLGVRCEAIWSVANSEYRTMRLSYGHATMIGDRRWVNDQGGELVFNPCLWRVAK